MTSYFRNVIKIKCESFRLHFVQANCKMYMKDSMNIGKETASGMLTFDVSFFQFIVECNIKLGVLNEAAPRKYYGNIKVTQTENEK